MNNLDPKLAKYLSSAKQEIYNEYHGTGKKKGSKKRKQPDSATSTVAGAGFVIADDDGVSWGNKADDDEEDAAVVVEHRKTVFKPIGGATATAQSVRPPDEPIPDDEAPQVVGNVIQDAPTASSSSSRMQGGLQTAAALRKENERRRAEVEAEKRRVKAEQARAGDENVNPEEETIYRDKSGQKIDTKAERAEIARQRRAELEKEMQKMEWGKGVVQREERERRQRELEDMASKPMARYADDEDMNAELKDRNRWNDPAANFLTNAKDKEKNKRKGPQRPKYTGPMPAPNRFAIGPGYRWDGVDRSNGFERQLMQAGNLKKVRDAQARVFSTEDM